MVGLAYLTHNQAMGRKAKGFDAASLRIIERMASLGATLDDIAYCCDVSKSTLERWRADKTVNDVYEKGREQAKSSMQKRLWAIAMQDGDLKAANTATIFWLKAQAGWSDRPQPETENNAQVVIYLPDNGRGDGPDPQPLPPD